MGQFAKEVTRVSQEVGTEGYVSFCSADYASFLPVARTKVPVSIYVSCFLLRPITSISCFDDKQLTLVFHSKLGGQALVLDVEGTWRELTGVVNKLAANLTSQVCFFLSFFLFGHGFFWGMVFVFSGDDLRTLSVFPSLICTFSALLSSTSSASLHISLHHLEDLMHPLTLPLPLPTFPVPLSLIASSFDHFSSSSLSDPCSPPSHLPPLLSPFLSSHRPCAPPSYHPLLSSSSSACYSHPPPPKLELILTNLSSLGPIDRKSNESSRTWRFVQADRG